MPNQKKKHKKFLARRKFIHSGMISAVALTGWQLTGLPGKHPNTFHNSIHTNLCDILGIQYPIMQAGMGGMTSPELVAKVSEAGGFGILGGTQKPPEELRNQIKGIKELTSKPFGVNLLLHEDLIHPVDMSTIGDETVKKIQSILNQFRRKFGVKESFDRPKSLPGNLRDSFNVILEEKVAAFSIGMGNPPSDWIKECHDVGMKVIAMIATVEDAKTIAGKGVDVIVAQGSEAGGHRSTWKKRESREAAAIGTFALVPQVVDAVQQPVVAAGGITDGRGLIAAMSLGAQGVLIGTRFLATKESHIPSSYKTTLLQTSNDKTIVTDVWTGAYARVIQNKFTDAFIESKAPVFPPFVHSIETRTFRNIAEEKNDPEYYALYAGQGIGSFHDLPSADEVVKTILKEAEKTLLDFSKKQIT